MDESSLLCRTCGKKNNIFCDIHHEVIQKLIKFVPSSLDVTNQILPTAVCISCYQMIKTLVFNIEGICDMQKILKIQSGIDLSVSPKTPSPSKDSEKRSLVDDITKKYTNIKLRKISINSSPEKSSPSLATAKAVPPNTVNSVTDDEPKISHDLISPSEKADTHRCFMCISCSEKFQNFTLLEDHLKTCRASTTKQFKCFCGKVLSSKKELSSHVSNEHKKNKQQHICPVCKKVLSSSFNLQNHMMWHKKSHSKGVYMCHVCKMKYPDPQSLQKHLNICERKSLATSARQHKTADLEV